MNMYMLGYVFFMTLFRVQFMNLSMSYLKKRMVLQHFIEGTKLWTSAAQKFYILI